MNPLLFLVFFLILLFVFSAFFSASEAALIAINRIRLRHLVENKRRGAPHVYNLVSRMDRLIATILVGNNLVNTAIAAIGTLILSHFLGAQKGVLIGTFAITAILVIFCELIPKILGTSHPEGTAFIFRHLISFFIFIFEPITRILTAFSNGVIRLFGGNPRSRRPLFNEEEMKMMIKIGREEGFYGEHERCMLERIFRFDDTEVSVVMTPIEKMIALPVDVDEEELERVLLEEGHNRLPIYEGAQENVVGIVYVRDLIYLFKENSLINVRDLMSAPFVIPSNKKVAELLREFQARKIQIAIVKDVRTQKNVGLVTLEDLLEEIVGELEEVEPGI